MQKININKVELRGYVPGVIGQITELHATYYSKHWGLDLKFEAEVATELSEFLLRFDETHDGIWIAVLDRDIIGSIAIDGSTANHEGARLRWFIISPQFQGCGIGQLLMQKAIDFCRKANLGRVYLWTFAGLTAARHLYEKFGFVLDEEYVDNRWGISVTYQKFKLNL